MTDEVIELRERTGFPGMKILQFAFNPEDESIDSPHLAPANSVMYTGTHDNNTVLGWYRNEIMMRLVSTWLATLTVKNTKQCHTLCFVQSFIS